MCRKSAVRDRARVSAIVEDLLRDPTEVVISRRVVRCVVASDLIHVRPLVRFSASGELYRFTTDGEALFGSGAVKPIQELSLAAANY